MILPPPLTKPDRTGRHRAASGHTPPGLDVPEDLTPGERAAPRRREYFGSSTGPVSGAAPARGPFLPWRVDLNLPICGAFASRRKQASCETCNGRGYVLRPQTAYDLRVGESRRMHDPCPECDPVVGERRKQASDG